MSTSDVNIFEKAMRQAAWDIYSQAQHFTPWDSGVLRKSMKVRNSWGKYWGAPEYLSDLEKLHWETQRNRTTSGGNPFTTWHTDPNDYSLDQLCLFEEDDSWQQKRSRLMEWLDQRLDASSTTAAGPGTTPSRRW